MSKTFEQHLTILGDALEDAPDPWFNNPKGWLRKPDYKRPAQERINIDNPGAQAFSFANILSSGYKMRWFVLDIAKKRLVYYKDNKSGTPESGLVELKYILEVQPSVVFDAPEFALDLISRERHYTVVAPDHNSMIRWAFAFNLALQKERPARSSPRSAQSPTPAPKKAPVITDVSAVKWFRYDVIYEDPGPLMVNVMGLANRDRSGKVVNNWIIVTSFENHPDGKPGRSELSGMISVKDYMVGVNGLDLTTYSFNDAMDAVVAATWPKTIHFLRDNHAVRDANRAECWAFVYYPSLNRRRRRYIELRSDSINFRKPAPGGSASGRRDAYITIDNIAQIRPVIDKNLPVDQQFVLNLICKEGAVVELLDEDDSALAGIPVEILELCFAKQQQMNAWRSAFASPPSTGDVATPSAIPILPVETIEAVVVAASTTKARLGVKSNLTGRFAVREFNLTQGTLRWKRPKGSSKVVGKERTFFIANSSSVGLRSCRPVIDILEEKTGFKYQIILQDTDECVTMAMASEEVMNQWLNVIRDAVAISPGSGSIFIPTAAEATAAGSSRMADDDFDLVDDSNAGGDGSTVQGYLFKKGERVAPGIGSENFRKRWFVLKDFTLWYFKSAAEARSLMSSNLALGSMDLRSALEVREATGHDSPENGIEVVTPTRVYLLVAEDEDEQLRWLDALSDMLEIRVMAVREDDITSSNPSAAGASSASSSTPLATRIAVKRKAIIHSGMLSMKSVNRLTGIVTWKDRYFVVANGSITYYDYPEDYFDEDKDCLGEISLMSIKLIETSDESKQPYGYGFDMHAHVLRGGDSNGMRVFTLFCKSVNECKEWMSEICTAHGTFELRMKSTAGGLRSFINETAVREREANRRRSSALYANAATIQKIQAQSGSNEVSEGGYKPSEDEDLTEEEAARRKLAAMNARHRPSSILAVGGRGGAGRSNRTALQRNTSENDDADVPSMPPPPVPDYPPPVPPSPSAAEDNGFEYRDEDQDEVTAAVVSNRGPVAASAARPKGHVLSTGGRGRGAGRGIGFQNASRRGSAIASGEM